MADTLDPQKKALVEELIRRMPTLPPEKQALVRELARRYQMPVEAVSKPAPAPEQADVPRDIFGQPLAHKPTTFGAITDIAEKGMEVVAKGAPAVIGGMIGAGVTKSPAGYAWGSGAGEAFRQWILKLFGQGEMNPQDIGMQMAVGPAQAFPAMAAERYPQAAATQALADQGVPVATSLPNEARMQMRAGALAEEISPQPAPAATVGRELQPVVAHQAEVEQAAQETAEENARQVLLQRIAEARKTLPEAPVKQEVAAITQAERNAAFDAAKAEAQGMGGYEKVLTLLTQEGNFFKYANPRTGKVMTGYGKYSTHNLKQNQNLIDLFEEVDATMPEAQKLANPGYRALDQLLNGPAVIPVLTAEKNLGAIKSLARTVDARRMTQSQRVAVKTVEQFQADLDKTVSELDSGAEILKALHNARARWREAQETFARPPQVRAYTGVTETGTLPPNPIKLDRVIQQTSGNITNLAARQQFDRMLQASYTKQVFDPVKFADKLRTMPRETARLFAPQEMEAMQKLASPLEIAKMDPSELAKLAQVKEPVELFNAFVKAGETSADTSIELLKSLQQVAPQAIPRIARGAFDRALRAPNQWLKLGDETKLLLLKGDAEHVKVIDEFMQTLTHPPKQVLMEKVGDAMRAVGLGLRTAVPGVASWRFYAMERLIAVLMRIDSARDVLEIVTARRWTPTVKAAAGRLLLTVPKKPPKKEA